MVPYVDIDQATGATYVRWVALREGREWGFNEPKYRRADFHYDFENGDLGVEHQTAYEGERFGIGAMMPTNLGPSVDPHDGHLYAYVPWRLMGTMVIYSVVGKCIVS